LEELKSAEGEVQDKKSFTLASSVLSGFDYGFVSRSQGVRSTLTGGGFAGDGNDGSFESYGPPANIIVLGSQQFIRNLKAMKDEYDDEEEVELTPRQRELREKLEQLTLNSTAIWERELAEGPLNAPFLIKIPYVVLCWFLDVLFEGRYVFSRFFLLETVARMPYFSYITMLHLYESLGFWRRSSDIKRIHFAEEWNEFHHLLIMESLGGDQRWWVRAVSQHSAMVYYIVLCILWAMSPTLAYKFSELLESHAVNTYGGFVEENKDLLKTLPPSMAAIQYYSLGGADPFFGEYQTTALATGGEVRNILLGIDCVSG
jgi:ubiquinol oxidase